MGGEKRGAKRKGEERKEGKEDILAIEAPVFSASFPSLSLPFSSLLLSPPFLPLSLPVYATRVLRKVRRRPWVSLL